MRAVLQRVRSCEVAVGGVPLSSIGEGLLVLLGVARGDGERELAWMADKVLNIRLFPDSSGRMNHSVLEAGGQIMVVSQFTLLGDCRKGRRPSFFGAEDPALARPLCERFARALSNSGLVVETGEFGAMMDVSLVNWGPVTVVLDCP